MRRRRRHPNYHIINSLHRILAVGWDMQVTEFNDVEGREYGDAKKWPMFHTDDITCADVKLGEGVITATYSGELIFWKLETGQPYRRYNVATPEKFIELKYRRKEDEDEDDNDDEETRRASERRRQSYHVSISRYVRKSISDRIRELEKKQTKRERFKGRRLREADEGEAVYLEQQCERSEPLPMSVQAVLFLQTRPMTKEHGEESYFKSIFENKSDPRLNLGSVFVSLETGVIQIYSHHHHGGYLDQFNAIHKTGDCVLSMATDRKNRYLFNGTAFGYIKIWYIENFG